MFVRVTIGSSRVLRGADPLEIRLWREAIGESGPRSLASFGPRGGSGQGLVGRLERALRFSECFHPLEDFEGSTVRVGGDAKGHDPTIDTNGNGVANTATALGLVQFSGHARQRDNPTCRALGQCGRESMCRRRRGAAVHEHEFDAFVRTLRERSSSINSMAFASDVDTGTARNQSGRPVTSTQTIRSAPLVRPWGSPWLWNVAPPLETPLARCVSMTTIEGNGSFRPRLVRNNACSATST